MSMPLNMNNWYQQPPPGNYLMNEVNQSNQAMPPWLQIDPNWGHQEQKIAQDEYMQDYVNPASGAQIENDIAKGSGNSTFSAARNANIQTMGARQAMLAGIDAKNAAVNQKLGERGSYMQVPTAGLTGYGSSQYGKAQGQGMMAQGIANGASMAAPYIGQFFSGVKQGMMGY